MGLAVPISIPRKIWNASAVTISASCPLARNANATATPNAVFPLAVGPAMIGKRTGVGGVGAPILSDCGGSISDTFECTSLPSYPLGSMPIPRVAIVGRPNVGKSSLMNMIAGAKVSIVDPTPGVTRDRVTAIAELAPPDAQGPIKPVEFVDTGGFGVYVAEGERFDEVGADLAKLTDSIEYQIEQAVESADVILFVVDAQAGVTPADRQIAQLLRERRLGPKSHRQRDGAKKKGKSTKADQASAAQEMPEVPHTHAPAQIRVVANKVDGPRWEAHALDIANLGFGEPMAVSAKTNYFRRDFLDAIYDMLPRPDKDANKRPVVDLMLAIIGKRNAGKSTLVNTLAGAPRVIVSEIAGTTRDAVDVRFEMDGRSVIAIDTAGLRRKRSFQTMVEHFAFDRAQRAIERCDVALLLLDATEKISQVDEQLGMILTKSFKPAVVVVNKWDQVESKPNRQGIPITVDDYEKYIRAELRGLWFAPIAFISAKSGRNVRETIDLAMEMRQQAAGRVTTGVLNRMFRRIIDRQGPTDKVGHQAKIYYVAQTGVEPPTITLVVNRPELFRPNYMRFLMNRLREETDFKEVPIRLVIRARRQREDDLALTGDGETNEPARVKRGTRGSDSRARTQRSRNIDIDSMTDEQLEALGKELLSDDGSEAVGIGPDETPEHNDLGDDPDDYFKD